MAPAQTDNQIFYGKYRGTVVNNFDPLGLGRLQVSVPDVLGDITTAWAMPCVPFAGKQMGLYAIPPKDAHIWVEFEGGDPDSPIWSGCFWDAKEGLRDPLTSFALVFKTKTGGTFTLKDEPKVGGVLLEVKLGGAAMSIGFTAAGIEIKNGGASIKLSPATVSVNNGALEVT